jgi:leader peptidase (prepilin peptidase)/N-methyltransferase
MFGGHAGDDRDVAVARCSGLAPDLWPIWLPPLVLAPFVGSFLGVLIRDLPAGRMGAIRRSACETCGHRLGPAELLPIVSFMLQGGRCRHCGDRIAGRHLAVELGAVGVAVWAASALPDAATLWAGCLLGWTLLALGWIDWEHMRLPDVLTLPLLLAGLVATWALEPDALIDHAIAAVAGYAAFRLLEIGYRALRGRDGLGQGDAKLAAAAGAWAGLAALPIIVFGAALVGLCIALVVQLRGGRVGAATALPFGPALALALWVVWLYGLA